MADWQSRPFEDCIEPVVYTTKVQRKDFLADGAYPVVSQEEAFVNGFWDQEADLFRVERPVVVFGDHTRALKYIDFDFVLGADGVKVLKPKPFLHPRFFYYQLHIAKLDSLGYARHYRLLREHYVAYPAYAEQRRIVAILDEAFEGIATAKANAEKNLQNARELFEAHLQAVFSQRVNGWVSKTVQQWVDDGVLAKPQDGNHGEVHPTKADYVDAGVPFVMAADMIDGAVDTEGCRFVTEAQARSLRIGFAKTGDVLLSHKGTIGRVAILDSSDDCVVLTPQVTYYRSLDSDRLFNRFLYYCLLSPEFQAAMNRIAGAGSTRAYIGITRQLDLLIALPSIDVQMETTTRLRHIDEATSRLTRVCEAKLASLDELKRSLLHQAFTGALTAKSTDSQLQVAAA